MPKGGGGGGGKGNNKPPSSAGRIHKIDYSNPQAAGLKVLISPHLFHGRVAYPELAFKRPVTWVNPSDNSWAIHPEIGSMVNQSVNAYQSVAHADYMWIQRQMTVAAWVYPLATSSTRRIVTKSVGGANADNEYILAIINQVAYFYAFSGATSFAAVGGTISQKKLHHICGVIDAGHRIKMYVDGRLVNDAGVVTGNINNHTAPFITGFATLNYVGYIGDVRLYNRGLSAAEVSQLYDPATRWDLYDFVGGYGSSGPGDLPLPPPPPPPPATSTDTDIQQRTGAPFMRI